MDRQEVWKALSRKDGDEWRAAVKSGEWLESLLAVEVKNQGK